MTEDNPNRIENSTNGRNPGISISDIYRMLAPFRQSENWKAIWQLTSTLVLYFCTWYLMIRSVELGYSYLWTLLLAVPAAAFLVRIFIFFHDCAHGSFFSSKKANSFFGYICGVLVFTDFAEWRYNHLRHHVSFANLDERGYGDVWTLTVAEYRKLSKWRRGLYRLYRNPVVLFFLGGLILFLIINRYPDRRAGKKVIVSVMFTNLLILALVFSAAQFIGLWTYFLIQIPVIWMAGAAGIWLFYVQHQFSNGYWARGEDWDRWKASMEGCSFYRMPAILRWCSGNIGYHHIHHLNPLIPNYNLKRCYDSVPVVQIERPVTLLESLSCPHLKLWDEEKRKMVFFP